MGSLRFSLRRTQVRVHLRTASAEVEKAVERKRVEMEREAATLRSEGEKYRQGCLEALQLAEEKTRQYKALKEAGGSASDEAFEQRLRSVEVAQPCGHAGLSGTRRHPLRGVRVSEQLEALSVVFLRLQMLLEALVELSKNPVGFREGRPLAADLCKQGECRLHMLQRLLVSSELPEQDAQCVVNEAQRSGLWIPQGDFERRTAFRQCSLAEIGLPLRVAKGTSSVCLER